MKCDHVKWDKHDIQLRCTMDAIFKVKHPFVIEGKEKFYCIKHLSSNADGRDTITLVYGPNGPREESGDRSNISM